MILIVEVNDIIFDGINCIEEYDKAIQDTMNCGKILSQLYVLR